ncbi:YebC/PmpR family DNA-binding transcriptional regulator [Candidatus Vondammii sp. HM_W22]|uniref:YebC/PmpR family DNA-binding transcriptional regulator n=1 Tax=Candidatus Vondammii sp. HM_W22 TaxID=2687299 RepID=UPI001F129C90|nr:YebC/PmpR family DNA-binding transcriptional regulator [Candidatus Vondammii sp. HM_W22]
MAGHSKWANIKHKKAANDKKRGKIWTKLLREVMVAAKAGGGDADANPRLRLALDKANGANVPKDTIDRAIKRGTGGDDMDSYDELRYEGYGPGGTAVIVDCMTDNRNRTASEVRHAFTKAGGNLGTDGSVSYMFSKQGIISFGPDANEDTIMEAALEAGAEDVITHDDGSVEVVTSPDNFSTVNDAIVASGLAPDHAEMTFSATTLAKLDRDTAEKLLRMVDVLEDLDDVQDVYTNADISDEILDAIG